MGAGEESSRAKSSKPTASTQEMPTAPLYADWSSMQHPMVPPYGTPLPYPALYPHGGPYAHPNMAVGTALTNTESEGKAIDGKDPGPAKKSKGTTAITSLTGGKSEESGKAASGSGNDGLSQSAESASEGSSEASDEDGNQQASSATKKKRFNQMLPDGRNEKSNISVQYNGENPSATVTGKPVLRTTNLNIGMDLWNASPAGATPMKTRPNASDASPQVGPATGREAILHDHQLYVDERELKREKRKQSNRESARRSRMRKQV
ncbi:hypothetical protein F0562_027350 [Nyssa sinensis]|uniref:BZIP domain-containing protein n=1 Tax=Nyssa sinensis TaxID=561372 RepID=A0A5J5B4W2_9ASTE|nr:hypothetical protein F0562_027350 [Nyssa sinensis]